MAQNFPIDSCVTKKRTKSRVTKTQRKHAYRPVLAFLCLLLVIPTMGGAKNQTPKTVDEITKELQDVFEEKPKEQADAPAEQNKTNSPRKPIKLIDIEPLYTDPKMEGEGKWKKIDLFPGRKDEPSLYTTFYRPGVNFPNAIVYMVLFEMKDISMELFLGSGEPLRKKGSPAMIHKSRHPALLAVTNALWQSRHTGKTGIIYKGELLKEMAKGKATIVVYKDGSVDVREWSDDIPIDHVKYARQLKHLILQQGQIVTTRLKNGKMVSAEIGLGSLLNEEQPVFKIPSKDQGKKPRYRLNLNRGVLWFLATRSAFGIRPDGNLVFAVGHHIRTTDLAKALALAGCVRGMHGDANPGNAIGVLYYRNKKGKLVKRERLSPLQHWTTVNRYLKRSYPKDFFAYFERSSINDHKDEPLANKKDLREIQEK